MLDSRTVSNPWENCSDRLARALVCLPALPDILTWINSRQRSEQNRSRDADVNSKNRCKLRPALQIGDHEETAESHLQGSHHPIETRRKIGGRASFSVFDPQDEIGG